MSRLGDLHDEAARRVGSYGRPSVQRALSLHWELRPQHPGRSLDEPVGTRKIPRAECRQSPKGAVHPIALQLLERMNLPTEGLRSKSWDEFAVPEAAPLDFVFTVCDNAAGEACPYWPGQPMTAHWGVPDPAAVEGTDAQKWLAFRNAFQALDNRIKIFTSLPLASLDRIKLQERLDAIGKTLPAGGS